MIAPATAGDAPAVVASWRACGLRAAGIPKVQLMVRGDNHGAIAFHNDAIT
ncbi:hypothetical protein QLH51_14320 [Sphingomonas sp. 2R-10]|uniref:hypothetical protein n=1 Tax=Sphingomonas sp. 2R-10 TaxID=3045148 RepID=UPI0013DDB009|nr:hypothetical protein [Sphingomonas sp. 2R-10]MDJ0277973.1 hypothetical protein [Sphingomonas sp. 2R-10]